MEEGDHHDLILRFAIALAIGLVVGVERGWRERDAPAGSRTAGVRTYSLVALLGAASAAIAEAMESPLLVAASLIAFAGVFSWFKIREAAHDETFSVTGVVAALIVFALGTLTVLGDYRAAAAGGVLTAAVLAGREVLHSLLKKLTWAELRSALLLLAMTIVVLPLLPDRAIDPYGGVNPREIWIFTVLTAAISFAGYVAVKLIGPSKGILVSGVAGALVSSTAVTVSFARRAAEGGPAAALAGGAALAGVVSILRVLVIAGLVMPVLLPHLAPAALAGAALLTIGGLRLLHRPAGADGTGEDAAFSNPIELVPLLVFAAGFAGVALVSGWMTGQVGAAGIFVTSGVFALFDVDVATLTAARLVGVSITAETAALAVLLALAVNAAARTVYAFAAGPFTFSGRLLAATAAALAAALVVAALTLAPETGWFPAPA